MNAVDQLLKATADYLEARIAEDPDLRRDLALLFTADRHPSITRMLFGFQAAECVIVMGTPSDAHH